MHLYKRILKFSTRRIYAFITSKTAELRDIFSQIISGISKKKAAPNNTDSPYTNTTTAIKFNFKNGSKLIYQNVGKNPSKQLTKKCGQLNGFPKDFGLYARK